MSFCSCAPCSRLFHYPDCLICTSPDLPDKKETICTEQFHTWQNYMYAEFFGRHWWRQKQPERHGSSARLWPASSSHTQNFDRLNRAFVCPAEVDDENVWVGVFCQHYVHHETENKNRWHLVVDGQDNDDSSTKIYAKIANILRGMVLEIFKEIS